MKQKIRLISFADGAFSRRKTQFQTMATRSGLFDRVDVFDFKGLPKCFQQKHGAFMKSSSRGFGYWVWKPKVILEGLEQSEEGECIVYMDAGFTINPNGALRFLEYIEITNDSPYKMLSFQSIHTESHWTKQDCANYLGVKPSSRFLKTSQLGSGLVFLRKTRDNIELLQEWLKTAVAQNYHFSNDAPSKASNHPLFREHRHDQSISSLLRKIRGTEITHYEVQSYKGQHQDMAKNLPALATRTRKNQKLKILNRRRFD